MGCFKSKSAKKYEVVIENGVEVQKVVEVKKEEVIQPSQHKKILILGSDYTGKTSIVKRYTQDTFEDYVAATTIVSNFGKTVDLVAVNGKSTKIRLENWDSPGEDSYRNIRKNFF